VSLIKCKGKKEEDLAEAAEAFLLPFRLSPGCAPAEITVGAPDTNTTDSSDRAAAMATNPEGGAETEVLPAPEQQQTADRGDVAGAYGGVISATGARLMAGEASAAVWTVGSALFLALSCTGTLAPGHPPACCSMCEPCSAGLLRCRADAA
jgi:hypothetical protein